MTHTLHRLKNEDRQTDDYVVLIMPAKGINNSDSKEVFKKYIDILYKFDPINLGGIGVGNLALDDIETIKKQVTEDAVMVHGVFKDRETLIKVLKALKDADYGYSVVVSGLVDDVDCCAKDSKIQRHSVDLSLGIWGAIEKLPPEEIMEITTMCGHAMISANLVTKMVEDIKKGRTTSEKAAIELAKPCACGIFNTEKAKGLLDELTVKL